MALRPTSLRKLTLSPPAADDVALVLHTSGSTGRPKRVPLTHANLSISAGNVARGYALGPDDVSMCVMPLFHVHGLVASMLATLRLKLYGRLCPFAASAMAVAAARMMPLYAGP